MPEDKKEPLFIGKLWDIVSAFFTKMFQSVWSGFNEKIVPILDTFIDVKFIKLATSEKEQWDTMLGWFTNAGLLDKGTATEIAKLRNLAFPLDKIMFFSVLTSIAKDWMAINLEGSSAELRQNLMAKWTPNLPSPQEVIRAAFIAPEKTAEIRTILKKNGIKDEYIDLLFLANYRLYDENIIAMLYLRGVLNEEKMYERMRELGYTDTRIKEIKETWSIIPGPQDLLTMVAHEAFEPAAIELMGLADEFPVEQVQWLEKQGLSVEWAKKYWYSHWEQPSVGQGFEMLQRGVITRAELDMLFRTVEIPPYWRDKLTKIAYLPYTRVDARRMHDLGILSDSDLLKAYMDLGYDKNHATNMMNFTIKLNRENDKELSKAEVLTGYKNRLISKTEVSVFLEDLGYTKEMIDYYVATIDYKLAQEYQSDQISVIKDKFQKNLITAHQARKELDALNLPAKQTDLSIEQWSIKSVKNTQLPSKEDLAGFLSAGIIPPETYADEMMKLGFPENYVAWYLQEIITKLGG